VRRERGLYGGVGVDEGARDQMDLVRLIRGDLLGTRRVRLNLLEGMIDGVHSSVAKERGAGNVSGKGVSGLWVGSSIGPKCFPTAF
jgi:hypothetical protein